MFVHSVTLSPNEKYFATGGRDKTLRIWDFSSGKLRIAVEAHPRDIQCVAFSPDSKSLAWCGYDSETKLWDAESGKPIRSIANVGTQIHWDAVAFSPNGKDLAMSGTGLRVIEVEGGKEIINVRPDRVQTTSLAWSPDGKMIVTGGMDRTIKIWDTTGKKLEALKGHNKDIQTVRFSSDGRWIATSAQNDAEIRLWPLKKKPPLRKTSRSDSEKSERAWCDDCRVCFDSGKNGGEASNCRSVGVGPILQDDRPVTPREGVRRIGEAPMTRVTAVHSLALDPHARLEKAALSRLPASRRVGTGAPIHGGDGYPTRPQSWRHRTGSAGG